MSPWFEDLDPEDGAEVDDLDPDLGEPPAPRPPREHHHHPALRRSTEVLLFALAAVVVAALAQGLTAPHIATNGSSDPQAAAPSPRDATATRAPDPAVRDSAVRALLSSRAAAIAARDQSAWNASQEPDAGTPSFARLAALPLTDWHYDVEATTVAPDQGLTVAVRLAYRFEGEASSTVVRERLTLRERSGRWLVRSEQSDDDRVQPWDLGDAAVVRGERSLVIGIDMPRATLRSWARTADHVVADVSAVWGPAWSNGVVLVVPHSTDQLARALARSSASLRSIAAVTTTVGTSVNGELGSARVWTNSPLMTSLSDVGREIVLRHEVTHVATGATATDATPLWLEEGFAEVIGYRHSGVSLRTALGDLAAAQQAGHGPTELPGQSDFAEGSLAVTYESAHLACAYLEEMYGLSGLVRIYRRTLQGTGVGDQNVDAALREVTGSGTDALTRAWHERLVALAG
jgi:hypothetical protein